MNGIDLGVIVDEDVLFYYNNEDQYRTFRCPQKTKFIRQADSIISNISSGFFTKKTDT